jgi:hypothetical protein
MSTIVELPKGAKLMDAGLWLDANMPNPPLPDPQRWSTGGWNSIEFADDQDATWFTLMWAGQ